MRACSPRLNAGLAFGVENRTMNMKQLSLAFVLTNIAALSLAAAPLETKPSHPYFAPFEPVKAPQPTGQVLKKADRLAICGDSITEQKMYSRIMETYLTVCVPELDVTVRQYGWGGEVAPGFLKRMTNDCLRFKPTIATTCYGMNDHGYRPYTNTIGDRYRQYSTAIVKSFKAAGTRVIQGSPGCVGVKGVDAKTGKVPSGWDEAGVQAKNLNLCTLRNIGIEIASAEKAGFADVFWPMLQAGFNARSLYSPQYAIAGGDGVHPGWAGHLVMAYAFLKSFGLNGDIGTFTVDLKADKAAVSKGHKLVSFQKGELQIESSRYPFCAPGLPNKDNSIRSGMTLVPFNQQLNRLTLIVKNAPAKKYRVTWGVLSSTYSADQLARGINLAEDFAINPFCDAFKKVDQAVADKQSYETKQVKQIFHGPEGKADMEAAVKKTEAERAPLAAAIKTAFAPVTHTIRITPE